MLVVLIMDILEASDALISALSRHYKKSETPLVVVAVYNVVNVVGNAKSSS